MGTMYTCLCGFAVGAAVVYTYHGWRSGRDGTNERQEIVAGMLAPLPTARSGVDIRDEYSRAFAQSMEVLRGKDIAAAWALAEQSKFTTIE